MAMAMRSNTSWILKTIWKMRPIVYFMPIWNSLVHDNKFQTRKVYAGFNNTLHEVSWRKVFYNNSARHRALFILWMACHERLATKERLMRFEMVDDDNCCFCRDRETLNHLFFQCSEMNMI